MRGSGSVADSDQRDRKALPNVGSIRENRSLPACTSAEGKARLGAVQDSKDERVDSDSNQHRLNDTTTSEASSSEPEERGAAIPASAPDSDSHPEPDTKGGTEGAELNDADGSETDAKEADAKETDGSARADRQRERKDNDENDGALLPWVVGILVILAVELFIYGHDGRIEVCVGIKDRTDFSLAGQPRTKENARKIPACAERMNLGMWGSSEARGKEALEQACKKATRFQAQQTTACLRNDGNWTRKVREEQIMPWDPRLYRRLLFLD
jgi:hypothetical protein